MFKTLTLLILISCALGACVTPMLLEPTSVDEELTPPSDVDLISSRIDLLEVALSQVVSKNCGDNIKGINRKINQLRKTKETTKVVEVCPEKDPVNNLDGKILVGAVENIRLIKERVTLNARVDTGAENSSIGAFNIKRFERDGKKWVRFSIKNTEDAAVYRYPIFDRVRIKQGESETERRIEIKMDISLGGVKYKKQVFNLANRSYLEYRLLIGRSFLRDIAVVDVSGKYLMKAVK